MSNVRSNEGTLGGFPHLPAIDSARQSRATSARPSKLLDPGLCLTLRPMAYPAFFEMYRDGIKNGWTVEEVDFGTDIGDLQSKMTDAERHLIKRLVAFFATGDSIVGNNLVLSLYRHLNAPEARMYLSRQLYEEALHVQFYLTLLDTYVPDPRERHEAFAAVETIPSIKRKADFCLRWMGSVQDLPRLETREHRRTFLLNLICFAACVEGLFFFGAFAYVYFLRSRGLLHGLAGGTNWVFRDESAHMAFAFEVVNTIRARGAGAVRRRAHRRGGADGRRGGRLRDAVRRGPPGRRRLGHVGGGGPPVPRILRRPAPGDAGPPKRYGARNPFSFLELQDVQEVTNFFERRVSAYQVGVTGDVAFDVAF